jgi:two-component system chemotaxis sensor kinase CheA
VDESMMICEPEGTESVMIRGECYPVLRLGRFYELKDYQEAVENGMMVIVEVDSQAVCLFVDKLVGKQEIVVKPIPDYVKKVKGLSGCTQLGDGSIALILDAANLIE